MTNRQRKPHAFKGFTLIEVLVALAVAALGLAAVSASVNQMLDLSDVMRKRTFANWIAQNQITEIRLANAEPRVAETEGDVEFAGQQWRWRAVVSETGVEKLFRVDVEIRLDDGDQLIRTVSGFLGEPTVPGQSNLAWAPAPAQLGDEE